MKYIKCIEDTALLNASNWYGIDKLNFDSDIVTVFRPSDNDWVMSDKENFDMGFLSDNNPDLENETHPITKDNILDVLKHNGINIDVHIDVSYSEISRIYIRHESINRDIFSCDFDRNWLKALEAITGKLKPLPKLEEIELKVGDSVEVAYIYSVVKVIKLFDYDKQKVHYEGGTFDYFKSMKCDYIKSVNGKSGIYKIPEFNFEQYLLDNGFDTGICNGSVFYLWKNDLTIERIEGLSQYMFCDKAIALTPQNADILIAMANLAKDLK